MLINHIHKLAVEIGPRGTGTAGEAAAADYVAGVLSSLGLPVERQKFRAVSSMNHFPLAVDSVALLAVIVYPMGGAGMRWLGALLALAAPLFFLHIMHNSTSPLGALFPKVFSRNVVTWREPIEEVRQHVVLLSHIDTNRARLAWRPDRLKSIEPLIFTTFGVLGFLGLLYLLGAVLGVVGWLWWVSLLPAGYMLGSVITLILDDHAPFTCGANDNAASVSVSLEVAAHLADAPLTHTQVWFAFTGAEETDQAGLRMFLQSNSSVLRNAFFIDLEGVGVGELFYLSQQGIAFHYSPDPWLLEAAARVAVQNPQLGLREAKMMMTDEVQTLRRSGYRAICIAGRDPSTKVLANWHRLEDTANAISEETMIRAKQFVLAMLTEIDAS